MTDLDLRLVRSFAVVAEHRHFGRAAAELHLTQPSLSRQIVRLERQVGARLLDRTPQGTRPNRITVGYIGNLIVTPAVRELRRRHPEAEVRTRHLAWDDARAALLEHRVDAAVVRLPLRAAQLHVTVLYDEPRVLLLPSDHRLAGRESVTLDDIAGEPLPRAHDADWDAFWRVDPRPDGSPAPGGPFVDAVEDKIELVASGQAVAIIPAQPVAVTGYRADLTTVPLDGVEPSQVAVATRAGERNGLVAAFRKYAEALLAPPG